MNIGQSRASTRAATTHAPRSGRPRFVTASPSQSRAYRLAADVANKHLTNKQLGAMMGLSGKGFYWHLSGYCRTMNVPIPPRPRIKPGPPSTGGRRRSKGQSIKISLMLTMHDNGRPEGWPKLTELKASTPAARAAEARTILFPVHDKAEPRFSPGLASNEPAKEACARMIREDKARRKGRAS
jgi:hypothetical protein